MQACQFKGKWPGPVACDLGTTSQFTAKTNDDRKSEHGLENFILPPYERHQDVTE